MTLIQPLYPQGQNNSRQYNWNYMGYAMSIALFSFASNCQSNNLKYATEYSNHNTRLALGDYTFLNLSPSNSNSFVDNTSNSEPIVPLERTLISEELDDTTLDYSSSNELKTDFNDVAELASDFNSENLNDFIVAFFKQTEKDNVLLSNKIYESFLSAAQLLSNVNFNAFKIQLLKDDGFKFLFKFSDDKMLIITKMIDDDFEADEIVFSLFKGNDLIQSDLTRLGSFVNDLENYLT